MRHIPSNVRRIGLVLAGSAVIAAFTVVPSLVSAQLTECPPGTVPIFDENKEFIECGEDPKAGPPKAPPPDKAKVGPEVGCEPAQEQLPPPPPKAAPPPPPKVVLPPDPAPEEGEELLPPSEQEPGPAPEPPPEAKAPPRPPKETTSIEPPQIECDEDDGDDRKNKNRGGRAAKPVTKPEAAPVEATQEAEQEAESGDVEQSFEVTSTGDNSNQCAGIQGTANTGNAQDLTEVIQVNGEADDFEFEEVDSSIKVSPNSETRCDQQVNQAASASG